MSTDIHVPAYRGVGAGGTWREEGKGHTQSHTSGPRHSSTLLSVFTPGATSATGLATSSISLDHQEYLKSGPGGLLQSVWGVVAEKEQRFGQGVQTRFTGSTYSRRRSLSGSGIVKRGTKRRAVESKETKKASAGELFHTLTLYITGVSLTWSLGSYHYRSANKRESDINYLTGHDSQTTFEVAEKEHTQPSPPDPIEVEDLDTSTIVCAIDTRLQNNTADNSEQSDGEEVSSKNLHSSTSPSTTTKPLPPQSPTSLNMSSRSSRYTSSSSSSPSSSTSRHKRHLSPPPSRDQTSPLPAPVPKKASHTAKGKGKDKQGDDDKDDWHQITEPEQRRRVQNRIAQRKFREKARSLKDQAARDEQNKIYAGCAYTCPQMEDLPLEYEVGGDGDGASDGHRCGEEGYGDGEDTRERGGDGRETMGVGGEKILSGLPWGGLSMRFVVGRGHEYYRYQTSRGSGSGSGTGTVTSLSPTITALNTPPPTSGDSWPVLQQRQTQQSTTYYGQATSGGSAGSSLSPYGMMTGSMGMGFMAGGGMDMDVDYTMAGIEAGGDYVTSPGSGNGGHGGSVLGDVTGMDVTYYDSTQPYYYGGSGGGGGSVYGSGAGGGRGRM